MFKNNAKLYRKSFFQFFPTLFRNILATITFFEKDHDDRRIQREIRKKNGEEKFICVHFCVIVQLAKFM